LHKMSSNNYFRLLITILLTTDATSSKWSKYFSSNIF
jgi:hypothetical protein